MNLSKELQMAIVNDFSTIKSVDVFYANGETVSGFLKNVSIIPLDVILCKHRAPRNESPYHNLDFDSAIKIQIIYQDGTVKEFI